MPKRKKSLVGWMEYPICWIGFNKRRYMPVGFSYLHKSKHRRKYKVRITMEEL